MASRGMGASFVSAPIHNKRRVPSVGTLTRGMNPRVFSVWSGPPGGGSGTRHEPSPHASRSGGVVIDEVPRGVPDT